MVLATFSEDGARRVRLGAKVFAVMGFLMMAVAIFFLYQSISDGRPINVVILSVVLSLACVWLVSLSVPMMKVSAGQPSVYVENGVLLYYKPYRSSITVSLIVDAHVDTVKEGWKTYEVLKIKSADKQIHVIPFIYHDWNADAAVRMVRGIQR